MRTEDRIVRFVSIAKGDPAAALALMDEWIRGQPDVTTFALSLYEELEAQDPIVDGVATSALVEARGDIDRMQQLLREQLDPRENPALSAKIDTAVRRGVVAQLGKLLARELRRYRAKPPDADGESQK
jgi:hypothetical protein